MAFFRRKQETSRSRVSNRKSSASGIGRPRTGNCLYLGESFPRAGELIQVSVFEVEFLYSQGQFPRAWTAAVHAIRDQTGEPDEPRVYLGILGTLMAMLEVTFRKLGDVSPELQASAAQASSLLRQGVDRVASYRELFAVVPDFAAAFDFEITKQVSLLASPMSAGKRAEAGWPYPDLWDGDLSLFHL